MWGTQRFPFAAKHKWLLDVWDHTCFIHQTCCCSNHTYAFWNLWRSEWAHFYIFRSGCSRNNILKFLFLINTDSKRTRTSRCITMELILFFFGGNYCYIEETNLFIYHLSHICSLFAKSDALKLPFLSWMKNRIIFKCQVSEQMLRFSKKIIRAGKMKDLPVTF